jgi:hypothetical protein
MIIYLTVEVDEVCFDIHVKSCAYLIDNLSVLYSFELQIYHYLDSKVSPWYRKYQK